jgi:hypothetical protein
MKFVTTQAGSGGAAARPGRGGAGATDNQDHCY